MVKLFIAIFLVLFCNEISLNGGGNQRNEDLSQSNHLKKRKAFKKKKKKQASKKKIRQQKKLGKGKKKTRKRSKRSGRLSKQSKNKDVDSLSAIKEMAKKYAPLVILHESERYFPSSVDFYFQHCALKDSITDDIVVQKGDITYDRLKQYSDKRYQLAPIGDTLGIYAGQSPEFQEEQKKYWVQAPCYTNFFQRKNGEIIFQYWFFYPFNGSIPEIFTGKQLKGQSTFKKIKSLGDHEGDWEHIDVCLSAPSDKQERTIKWAFYARHVSEIPNPTSRLSKLRAKERIRDLPLIGTDQAYYLPEELDFYDDTHPIVLSALFGHASYPKIPKIIVRPLDKFVPEEIKDTLLTPINKGLDRVSDQGAHWQTWNHLQFIASNGVPVPQASWLSFLGPWGSRGPNGPAAKDSWRSQEQCRSLRMTLDALPSSDDKAKFETQSFEIELLKHAQDRLFIRVDHEYAADLEIALFEGETLFADKIDGTGQVIGIPKTLDDLHLVLTPKQGNEEMFQTTAKIPVLVYSQENR